MKHRRLKRSVRRAIEFVLVIAAAIVLFVIARKIGVAERGNTLYGGEICVPFLVVFGWYGVKSIVKDVKGGATE